MGEVAIRENVEQTLPGIAYPYLIPSFGYARRMAAVAPDSGGLIFTPAGNSREHKMTIAKAVVVAVLRERGEHDRAGFVDRELPERIDPSRHVGLLAMLHIDPAALTEWSGSESA